MFTSGCASFGDLDQAILSIPYDQDQQLLQPETTVTPSPLQSCQLLDHLLPPALTISQYETPPSSQSKQTLLETVTPEVQNAASISAYRASTTPTVLSYLNNAETAATKLGEERMDFQFPWQDYSTWSANLVASVASSSCSGPSSLTFGSGVASLASSCPTTAELRQVYVLSLNSLVIDCITPADLCLTLIIVHSALPFFSTRNYISQQQAAPISQIAFLRTPLRPRAERHVSLGVRNASLHFQPMMRIENWHARHARCRWKWTQLLSIPMKTVLATDEMSQKKRAKGTLCPLHFGIGVSQITLLYCKANLKQLSIPDQPVARAFLDRLGLLFPDTLDLMLELSFMDEESFAKTISRYGRHDEPIQRLSSALGPDATRAVLAELCGSRAVLKLEQDGAFSVSDDYRKSRKPFFPRLI